MMWSGTAGAGHPLASGVYVLRMSAYGERGDMLKQFEGRVTLLK